MPLRVASRPAAEVGAGWSGTESLGPLRGKGTCRGRSPRGRGRGGQDSGHTRPLQVSVCVSRLRLRNKPPQTPWRLACVWACGQLGQTGGLCGFWSASAEAVRGPRSPWHIVTVKRTSHREATHKTSDGSASPLLSGGRHGPTARAMVGRVTEARGRGLGGGAGRNHGQLVTLAL